MAPTALKSASKIKIEPVPDSIASRFSYKNAQNVSRADHNVDAGIHAGVFLQ
jgi:hypothetical protein